MSKNILLVQPQAMPAACAFKSLTFSWLPFSHDNYLRVCLLDAIIWYMFSHPTNEWHVMNIRKKNIPYLVMHCINRNCTSCSLVLVKDYLGHDSNNRQSWNFRSIGMPSPIAIWQVDPWMDNSCVKTFHASNIQAVITNAYLAHCTQIRSLKTKCISCISLSFSVQMECWHL